MYLPRSKMSPNQEITVKFHHGRDSNEMMQNFSLALIILLSIYTTQVDKFLVLVNCGAHIIKMLNYLSSEYIYN
jgi:hypothetical protein